MDDIEMREAQLVLATLERQWDDDRNRSFALMEQLNAAEKRLLALFSGEWEARGGERRMIQPRILRVPQAADAGVPAAHEEG
jgi:hypothetical protein